MRFTFNKKNLNNSMIFTKALYILVSDIIKQEALIKLN